MEEYNVRGSVESKIRQIAEQFTGCQYMFADYAQANVEFDRVDKPTIMYVLPPSGTLQIYHNRVLDYPRVQLWFLCPSEFDFDGEENECRVEAMKQLGVAFIHAINESGLFEIIDMEGIPYQVAYDAYDRNLTGVCLQPQLREKEGLIMCGDFYPEFAFEKEEEEEEEDNDDNDNDNE